MVNLEVNLLEVLRIKILEHSVFCFLQLSHVCRSNFILLSTSFMLVGTNKTVRLGIHLTYIEDGEKYTCPPTL